MKILVTSSRMPHALPQIRALGTAGHTIHAADTFRLAPGNHSRWVSELHLTRSPRYAPREWIRDIEDIVTSRRIELVLPMFEEVFYLARHGPTIGGAVVFAAPFPLLARLHDKARFAALAADLGITVPESRVVSSEEELRAAIAATDRYFARPVFSRGGVRGLTNSGPLADRARVEDCDPTPANPWIVQSFVRGTDVCTFSVVYHGHVTAHVTYEHPRTIENAGGIVFESVDEPGTLEITRKIAEATGYHGQLSLDFIRRDDGSLVVIECNPRPTAGVSVMPPQMFVEGLLGPGDSPVRVAPAGARCSMRSAILRDLFLCPARLRENLRELFSSTPDLCFAARDAMPGIYQILSLSRMFAYRKDHAHYTKTRSDLVTGYLHDATWDGTPIPELSSVTRRSLHPLRGDHRVQALWSERPSS
jgi:hypothetical protein